MPWTVLVIGTNSMFTCSLRLSRWLFSGDFEKVMMCSKTGLSRWYFWELVPILGHIFEIHVNPWTIQEKSRKIHVNICKSAVIHVYQRIDRSCRHFKLVLSSCWPVTKTVKVMNDVVRKVCHAGTILLGRGNYHGTNFSKSA